MARTITDEEIKLSIIINGNPAQKQLLDLEKATRALTEENKSLNLERKRLEAQGKKDSAEYKALTATIKANTTAITSNKAEMKELQNQIGITGLTMAQLRQKATVLRATLSNLVPGSADYIRYQADLTQVNNRIGELNGRATRAGFSLGTLADGFNRYAALAASVVAVGTGVVLSVQKIIDASGKLSDAQSDVIKTTGLTKQEVDELTKSFGMLKTRTARIELLELATEAGRLGITGTENVRAFVEQANKLKVALGDDLSDEAIREVGKMVNVYKVGEATGKDFAGSMDALGSSINEVAASGANQAGYLVDYLKRQAGIVSLTNISAANNVAYAATFDEIGQSVEVSATAMNKVWMDMAKNPEAFAKVIGISTEAFKKMFSEDANGAMLKFLESLKNNKAGASGLLDSLKDIEAGGTRGDSALLALANSTDVLTRYQTISNQALQEATSLTDEYNLKNNNLQATLEKIQKRVMGFFVAEDFVTWLGEAAQTFAKFIGATDDADGKVTAWRNTLAFTAKVIAIVTAAIITNVAWQKLLAMWSLRNTEATLLYTIASKARAFADGVATIGSSALAIVTNLVVRNTTGAAAAFRTMTAAMMATPWGFILGIIAAIATAYVAFSDSAKKAASSQSILNNVRLESEGIIKKEIASLDVLLKIARDENQSKENRLKAIKQINEISPEYLKNLTLETINTNEATDAINKYIASLDKKAMKEAFVSQRSKIQEKINEAKADKDKRQYGGFFQGKETDFSNYYDLEIDNIEEFKKTTQGWSSFKFDAYRDYKNQIILAQEELGFLNKEEAKFLKNNADLYLTKDSPADFEPTTPGEKPKKAKSEKKYDDSYLNDEAKRKSDLIRLRKEAEEERISILENGYAKEVLLENLNHSYKLDRLANDQEQLIAEKTKLEKKLVAAEKSGDSRKIASYKNQLNDIEEELRINHTSIERQAEIHNLRLGTIQEKAGLQEVQKLKEKYDLEAQARETNFLESHEYLSATKEERQKLQEKFNQEELKHQEAFYNEQINLLENMLNDVDFEGIDYSLLSEEDEEKLRVQIEAIKNAIAKLKAAKNGEEDEGAKEIDLGISANVDVLGFSQDQWDNFFKNIEQGTIGFQTMSMAIQAAGQIFSQLDQYMTASENASLKKYEKGQDSRKRALKRQLDSGQINQVQYKRKVEELDQELDKKKADIEYRQAKRQRLMAIANIVMNTAQAIIGIWAQFPKFDFGATAGIMSGVVGALGALQLATVLKTPLPTRGFEEGLYPDYVKREQDGKMFKSSGTSKMQTGLFSKPRILVGEGPGDMPEMVIDKKAFSQISPETKNALFRELQGIKGFEQGFYKDDVFYSGGSGGSAPASGGSDLELIKMMFAVVAENTIVMKDLRDSGVIAYMSKDFRNIKKLNEEIEKFKALKEKNKQ